jgi:hypothetical protein
MTTLENTMRLPCAIYFHNVAALPCAAKLPAAIIESRIMLPADLRRFIPCKFGTLTALAATLTKAGFRADAIDSQGRVVA